jgi:hypothetical protein
MALQMMATGAAISNELALVGTFARDIGQRLGATIAGRVPGIFDPYRPELPEKHGLAACKKHSRS